MNELLLGAVLLVGLLLTPLGLPGTWVMVAAAAAYGPLTHTDAPGWVTIVGVAVLAFIAEVFEWTLGARYARKYGGSRRASWGAVIGGTIGAFAGVPLPIIGSMIGAFVGSFAGAFIAELTRGGGGAVATRVAWGALLGRVVAIAIKSAVGLIIVVWILGAVLLR
jgi:uncharacterized protein YqgC (DUF456 family)